MCGNAVAHLGLACGMVLPRCAPSPGFVVSAGSQSATGPPPVQVAVRLADLEEAGPGRHACKVTLLECTASSAAAPGPAHRPSISIGAMPSPTPDPPLSPHAAAPVRKGERKRAVGTLQFVFEALVDRRAAEGSPAAGNIMGADSKPLKHGGELAADGFDASDLPARMVTGFPGLDEGAESSGGSFASGSATRGCRVVPFPASLCSCANRHSLHKLAALCPADSACEWHLCQGVGSVTPKRPRLRGNPNPQLQYTAATRSAQFVCSVSVDVQASRGPTPSR